MTWKVWCIWDKGPPLARSLYVFRCRAQVALRRPWCLVSDGSLMFGAAGHYIHWRAR